jgi:perosamine synthetase
MNYNTVLPYFPAEDIDEIIIKIRNIIEGQGVFTKGPNVESFERSFANYISAEYGVAVNSGTSALEIALKSIGISQGDEVIVPTQTFISTGSCVVNNGGTPVFCEIDKNHVLDFVDLTKKVTEKTKAVIIVHFLGLIHPDIFKIRKYLKERSIYLIEDAAHAHGAKIDGIFAGNIGDFGCFSFYSTKIITTGGEGGLITTNSKDFYELCSSLRTIGLDVTANTETYSNIGSNKRISEIQAILGMSQLKRLEDFINHRNKIANVYRHELTPLVDKELICFQEYSSNIRHSYWRFLVSLKDKGLKREGIKDKLGKFSIKVDWPYQPLMHLQPVFKKLYGEMEGQLGKSEEIAMRHFCLPIHIGIKEKDAIYIAQKVIEVIS